MKDKLLTTAVLLLFVMALAPVTSWAQVTGQCADCHTMHNSQDGAAMAMEWNADYTTTSESAVPFAKLLVRDGCLGCHAGARSAGNDMLANCPKVLASEAPQTYGAATSDTSAGGNLWWTKLDDSKGHNVAGLDVDGTLTAPPGHVGTYDEHGGVRGVSDAWNSTTNRLTCAGTYGCHGTAATADEFNAISGAHHGVDTTLDGLTCAKSYRFLNGILGIEDDDWEHSNSAADHNQYHGENRTNAFIFSDKQTISYLCCECHGVFHSADSTGTAAAPWLRHPTDFDLESVADSGNKEYQYYNGGTAAGAIYSTTAPVASDLTIAGLIATGVQETVLDEDDDAIVTCISCHRAHGSPYADILRWDYSDTYAACVDGAGAGDVTMKDNGCFICHTTKDN